jgi:beta-glucanase (GH16 family)
VAKIINIKSYMKNRGILIFWLIQLTVLSSYAQPAAKSDLRKQFITPPFEYRSIFPFRGAGGSDYRESESIQKQLEKIYSGYGYGGIIVSPTTDKPFVSKVSREPGYMQHVGSGLQKTRPAGASPWVMVLPQGITPYKYRATPADPNKPKPAPLPAYMSKEYFNQLREILAYSKENGRKVVFYDEVGYPSGIANHTTPEKYLRKLLEKKEEIVSGPAEYNKPIPEHGTLMAVVAMNSSTKERIDLMPLVKNNALIWKVPSGNWKVMTFNCVTAKPGGGELDYPASTDYMDPEATNWFIGKVYDPLAKEVGEYFGNTLFQTFFDDVGIFDEERTWTAKFNEKFIERTGLNPALYYPALWENIGPETDAARVAFFDTRAELLADGFPKIVTDWGIKNKIEVSGHCPGNYDPQPVDMNGDPFKYYRAQPVPLVDVIFSYPTGRDGFKLISDGADFYDKPIVAAETFSSFSPPGLTAGYRRLMELYIRGINRLMGSGIPFTEAPGDSAYFAEWVGRHSMMLQGGKRVSDIAIFYPIADLEAFYHFDAPEYTKDMRWGSFVPYDNDYLAVGEMLLGEVHRDFTIMHPDFLLSDRIKINGANLDLVNKVNSQSYKVLILPGQKVISLKALQKIKAYYDNGGKVIATSLLPSKSAELAGNEKTGLANDKKVQEIIKEMFGIDPSLPMPDGVSAIRTNKMKGNAVFIRKPDGKVLSETLDKLGISADIRFEGNPSPSTGGGMFSFIHKQTDNRDIYLFANSSDDAIDTYAEVKGTIKPELWDPATGKITSIVKVEYLNKNGQEYTRFPLSLKAVSSVFVVSADNQNFKLIWSDEFNGEGAPDPAKWDYETGYIRNDELQYYTKSTANTRQHNGNLEITVRKEQIKGLKEGKPTTFEYSSGSIITLNKADWTYGKIEGRFKIPQGKGLWACFWTLGSNITSEGWPKSGEIDIFEHINSENLVHGTAHWADDSDKHVAKGGNSAEFDVTQWHTYSIVWTPESIKWYVDDVPFHEVSISQGANSTQEFHKPQYVLINLPIGGSWPGSPDATTVLPATLYCDYIRVYKLDNNPK